MQDAEVIRSGIAQAVINRKGAELIGWQVGATDLLWPRGGTGWNQTCPLMFPSCGWSESSLVEIKGRVYPMPVHGFISMQEFDVVSNSESEVILETSDNAFTHTMFPFNFHFKIAYKIANNRLHIDASVKNKSSRTILPYSIGMHPGFNWPLLSPRKDGWRLLFDKKESALVPSISSQGLIQVHQRKLTFDGRCLHLNEGLFQDEALCFLNANSKRLSLVGHKVTIKIDAPDARHWIVWSLPEQDFLALEPCTGHGDIEGSRAPFEERKYNINLAPGEERQFRVRFEFLQLED
ncbi:aldose 1-epimerase protein [Rhizobium etli]|uniref:aldose epimerase family protein n=1 Tax=Rhizobium etli TaxID=29449 RepID=UPI00038397F4|nr:aldose 1-epimerase protein [Rhizobium etli]AGS25455.1 aldose 1-epimerase protein [Rhizobium etli bv. mimosae str. Mim1]